VRRHHDEVAPLGVGELDDGARRLSAHHHHLDRRAAAGGALELLEPGDRLVAQVAVVVGPGELERHDVGVGERVVDHREQDDGAAARAREVRRDLQRAPREVVEVLRNEDLAEHRGTSSPRSVPPW